jgi:nuclear transport factor 2 (NTF2) superfamily protein
MSRPPLPPFNQETAAQKARMAEDAWNTRDPARVALAYFRKQPVAKPRGILSGSACDRGVSDPHVEPRA